MSSQNKSPHPAPLPCTWQPLSTCQECQANGKLMCHFDKTDTLHFFMIIFPFGVTAIAGTIGAGYGRFLWLWLAYAIFFFFVWEARVLCRHCPYWAEESNVLHCHANYGVIKIWKYQSSPMSKSERIQFIIGALLLIGFPFPFLLLGKEYLLVLIGLSAVVSGTFILRKNVCTRCTNFSCPMNAVPYQIVNIFLNRNPAIQRRWESGEYYLEK
jgi:hypothetical protein